MHLTLLDWLCIILIGLPAVCSIAFRSCGWVAEEYWMMRVRIEAAPQQAQEDLDKENSRA